MNEQADALAAPIDAPKDGRRRHRLLRIGAAIVLAGHGLVHLIGVALLWRLGQSGELRHSDVLHSWNSHRTRGGDTPRAFS